MITRYRFSEPQAQSWRDVLNVHPAADLFPLMEKNELPVLAADIKANGLRTRVAVWSPPGSREQFLLDGRNRLDASELAGIPTVVNGELVNFERVDPLVDPYSFVLSANIHRRHLTAEQKRELIAALLKASPEKSDRQIAGEVKADHKTVAVVRERAEARGEIPHVEKRTDSKGRKQPARAGWSRERFRRHRAKKQGRRSASKVAPISAEAAHDDIGPRSAAETARKLARLDELERENVRLKHLNSALESERDALQAQVDALTAELGRLRNPARGD